MSPLHRLDQLRRVFFILVAGMMAFFIANLWLKQAFIPLVVCSLIATVVAVWHEVVLRAARKEYNRRENL